VGRLAAVVVALTAVLTVPAALADGDPASDVLVSQDVFLPYPPPSDAPAAALRQQVAAAYAHGDRVKVAVVASPTDLGAVPSPFGQPASYAKFLSEELRYFYIGPLVVVMPAGYGIYDGGRSTASEEKVLAREQSAGSSADALTEAASGAIGDLLKANALRSRDVLPPKVFALRAYGFPGMPLRLQYRVIDDSHKAGVVIQVRRAASVVATISLPMRPAYDWNAFRTTIWRVPSSLAPAPLRFCVTATDPSGNRGRDCKQALISRT
jgi:hypothetical protein